MSRTSEILIALAVGLFVALFVLVPFRGNWMETPSPRGAVGLWETHDMYGYRHRRNAVGRETVEGSFDVTCTIDWDRNRVTPDPKSPLGNVVALGGSFTFGYGVEDAEAWPARLGAALPDWKVVNRGVSGWGTAQAVLALEEEIQRPQTKLVLYGWIPDHQRRNALRRSWIEIMVSHGRRHPRFELLENGRLEFWGVVGLDAAMDDDDPALEERERALTRAMFAHMRRLCADAKVPFVVLRFGRGGDEWLLDTPGFESVDLNDVGGGVLPRDGHPNAEWHAKVAERLVPLVRTGLE